MWRSPSGWGGGARPFGYERDGVTVRDDEAVELRAAAARVLAGDPVAAIAKDWNARGVATSRGGRWTGIAVRRTLTRMRNVALIEHEGTLVGPAQWPAVLDETTYAGVRAVLGDGSPMRRDRPRVERLLSGIARCGVPGCDGTLI